MSLRHFKTFGTLIYEYRHAAQMTQQQLADRVGISQRMISFYEMETHEPLAVVAVRIKDVLRIPDSVFFDTFRSYKIETKERNRAS